jgi:hypothetical protein
MSEYVMTFTETTVTWDGAKGIYIGDRARDSYGSYDYYAWKAGNDRIDLVYGDSNGEHSTSTYIYSINGNGELVLKQNGNIIAMLTKTGGTTTTVTGITSVSGGEWSWTVEPWSWYPGMYQSPEIGPNMITKARINFTSSVADASITIMLAGGGDPRGDPPGDGAFISTLDNGSATRYSDYYEGSRVNDGQWVTITIPVPTPGEHFVEIGYQKNGSWSSNNGDFALFKVLYWL